MLPNWVKKVTGIQAIEDYQPPMWASSIAYKASNKFGKRAIARNGFPALAVTEKRVEEMQQLADELTTEHKNVKQLVTAWKQANNAQTGIDELFKEIPVQVLESNQRRMRAELQQTQQFIALNNEQVKLEAGLAQLKQARKDRRNRQGRYLETFKNV